MTDKTATKATKGRPNGFGDVYTDSEWDICMLPRETLEKQSKYPVSPNVNQSDTWVLLNPEGSHWHCLGEQLKSLGSAELIWVNAYYEPGLRREDPKIRETVSAFEVGFRKLVVIEEALRQKRAERKASKSGLTVEQAELLKRYRHEKRRFWNLEVRRPQYLFDINLEIDALQRVLKLMALSDDDFLAYYAESPHRLSMDLGRCLEGRALDWLQTRWDILSWNKSNETLGKVLEKIALETEAARSKPVLDPFSVEEVKAVKKKP